jgi:hypothetical protein
VSLAHEFVAEMLGVQRTQVTAPARKSSGQVRNLVATLDGAVTLQNSAREKSAGTSGSRRDDNFTPRLRHRHAKIAVGSCRSEMTLDVEDTMGRGEDKTPSSLGNNRRSVPCPSPRGITIAATRARAAPSWRNLVLVGSLYVRNYSYQTEANMGFGRGILLWILGVPIPIIILLALFWHN